MPSRRVAGGCWSTRCRGERGISALRRLRALKSMWAVPDILRGHHRSREKAARVPRDGIPPRRPTLHPLLPKVPASLPVPSRSFLQVDLILTPLVHPTRSCSLLRDPHPEVLALPLWLAVSRRLLLYSGHTRHFPQRQSIPARIPTQAPAVMHSRLARPTLVCATWRHERLPPIPRVSILHPSLHLTITASRALGLPYLEPRRGFNRMVSASLRLVVPRPHRRMPGRLRAVGCCTLPGAYLIFDRTARVGGRTSVPRSCPWVDGRQRYLQTFRTTA